MVLFVHHHSVYPRLWLPIHSFLSAFIELYAMSKPTCYEDTQSSCKSPPCEGISPACAFYDVAHSVPVPQTCPVSFCKPRC